MDFELIVCSLFTLPQSVLHSSAFFAGRKLRHRPGLFLLGILLSGALSPIHAQTAYFAGAVTTLGGGFNQPLGVAVDGSGNVFVADTLNNAVKEVPLGCTSADCVTTVGGGFNQPYGVAVAGGTIYVADYGTHAVYQMPYTCNSASCATMMGGGLHSPQGLAVDASGNVYVADFNFTDTTVKEIPAGCTSSSCVATLGGGFNQPYGVAVDASGNVYVADSGNGVVTEMPPGCPSSSCETTLGGGFGIPEGVAVDSSGNVYVADYNNNAVYEMPPNCLSSGCVTTLGGAFSGPSDVAVNGSGNLYVTDTGTAVKELMPHGVNFSTVAVGTASAPLTLYFIFTAGDSDVTVSALTQGAKGLDFADAGTGTCDTNGTSQAYNPGDTCTMNGTFTPKYAGARSGAVQLSDAGGVIATAYVYGSGQGPQLVFQNNQTPIVVGAGAGEPEGLAVDASGNVYVADPSDTGWVMEFAAGCTISTCTPVELGGSNLEGQVFNGPFSIAVDGAGNVYVADRSNGGSVKKMPPGCVAAGCVTTLTAFPYSGSLAVDGAGNLYAADGAAIKELPSGCTSSGCVITLGGWFSGIGALTLDGSGNLYFIDDYAIKEMPPGCTSASCVTTLGGGFIEPDGVALDGSGNIYVTDNDHMFGGYAAVLEMPAGCASSSCVHLLGTGPTNLFLLRGVGVDGSGNVYVEDAYANRIYALNLATVPSLTLANTNVGSQSVPQRVLLRNIGNAPLVFPPPGSGENPSVSASFTLDPLTTCPEVLSSSSAGSLAAGASCDLAFDFAPTIAGPVSGSVMLTNNNLNVANATQSIGLSATGFSGTLITPTVTVTPKSSSVTTAQQTSVLVVVSGGSGNPTPTGSVTMSSGNSVLGVATTLVGGGATVTIPAGQLTAGNDTLTATYTPDSGSSSTYTGAAGTAAVTVVQAIGSCSTPNPNPNPNPQSFAAVGDFNGDCRSDILWHNTSTGQVYAWLMNGAVYENSGSPGSPTSDWVIQGAGDFDGDGKADILWRNSTTGQVFIWLMNGGTITGSGSLGYVSLDWTIKDVGDFNGDGKADILWWNSTTGQVYLWFVNGTTLSGGGSVSYVSGGWNIAGIGDFDGDGKADILWRNSTTGQVYVWLMNGTTLTNSGNLGYVSSDWSIAGVGDFNGDGKSDILWRNTSGEVYLWFMNGTATGGSQGVSYASTDWVIQGVGDYDGSGRAGILWRNSSTEQVYIWLMNGATLDSSGSPGRPGATWQIEP